MYFYTLLAVLSLHWAACGWALIPQIMNSWRDDIPAEELEAAGQLQEAIACYKRVARLSRVVADEYGL